MKRMETVGICDLDKAVAAKDLNEKGMYEHTSICLMAQFATRITGKKVVGSTPSAVAFEDNPYEYPFLVDGLSRLVTLFDTQEYEGVRKQLPRLVEVKYNYGK